MNIQSLLCAAVIAAMPLGAAHAQFTFENLNGANGSIIVAAEDPLRFTMTGSNNPGGDEDDVPQLLPEFSSLSAFPDFTQPASIYFTVADVDALISGRFRYITFDVDGSNFDPAGYFINDTLFQLSPSDLPFGTPFLGAFSFNVLVGDTWGFYINATDNSLGASQLLVGQVPEPASWAMLIAGFGLVGATMRRRRQSVAVNA